MVLLKHLIQVQLKESVSNRSVAFFYNVLLFSVVDTTNQSSKFPSFSLIKAGVHLKAVFPPLNLGLMRISHSHFKQFKNP